MLALLPVLAALFIIIGVPILFLSVPAAGMFAFVAVIWVAVTSIVIGGAFLAFGRYGVLATSAVFFAIFAWAIGKGVIGPRMAQNARCDESAAMKLQPARITQPARIVFDNLEKTMSFGNYQPDMVAVVTGAEVVEIGRLARGHIGAAWSTKASPGPVCTAPGSRNTLETSGPKQQRLDLCLTSTKLLEYAQRQTKTLDFGDAAPSILFVANAGEDSGGPRKCDVIDIYEEEGGVRRQLGRFIHDWRNGKVHPDPPKPGDALRAIIRAVLGDQVGEDALKQHFVD